MGRSTARTRDPDANHEFAAAFTHAVPRRQEGERHQKRRQDDEQEADAVDALLIADPQRWNPVIPLEELHRGGRRVDAHHRPLAAHERVPADHHVLPVRRQRDRRGARVGPQAEDVVLNDHRPPRGGLLVERDVQLRLGLVRARLERPPAALRPYAASQAQL